MLEIVRLKPWVDATRPYVQGESSAPPTSTRGSARPRYEADARLRAAEQLLAQGRGAEADAQLDQAVVFWQSVGATACVRDAEALLAASA